MRDRNRTWADHALCLLAMCALALLPAAATPGDEERAEPEAPREAVAVALSGSQVLFTPRVDGEAVTVTLSCADGTYLQREYEGVGPVALPLVSEEDRPIADGRCKYEVLVHPFVDREAMRAAQEAGDFATVERLSRIEQERMEIVTGSFEVAGGAIRADR